MSSSSSSASNNTRASCPCKQLPRCLSSFTAAEYGDLHALIRLGESVAHKRDAGGYTPLHLAAQNGHVAATCLLLRLGTNVDASHNGATPLHRASYAGAVSTMRILMEWNDSGNEEERCNLLVKDTSFGDNMTPLHKAAAGGRYLAVQLLLDALRARDNEKGRKLDADESLFCKALRAVDSVGRTPLCVAESLYANEQEEQQSVKRWDVVAGGAADWGKCVELLQAAETELLKDDAAPTVNNNRAKATTSALGPLPKHLAPDSTTSCLDCTATGDGRCLTASWESAFQSVLSSSVSKTLRSSCTKPQTTDMSRIQTVDPQQPDPALPGNASNDTNVNPLSAGESTNNENKAPVGQTCSSCHVKCFALCQGKDGTLMCRECANRSKRRTY